jgi:hypothetical protein
MSNCAEYKSPAQLGLNICTSDVPCYDGQGLSCVSLPSNPTLNDVIAAIDTSICGLQTLINAIDTSAQLPDPWLKYTNSDQIIATITNLDGTAGITTVDLGFGIIPVSDLLYNVSSTETVLVRGFVEFKVDVDTLNPSYSENGLEVILTFPEFSSVGSNVLSANKLMESDYPYPTHIPATPCSVQTQQQLPTLEPTKNRGAGQVYLGNEAGDNKILIRIYPNFTRDGRHNIRIGFDCPVELINA